MRVVSLLASGTELLCKLGAGGLLVGRSHECDDPPWVKRLPALSRPTFDITGSSGEIDRRVRERLSAGQPLYEIDAAALSALAPDLVITQSHCDVCAVGPAQVREAHALPELRGVRTVFMQGGSLEGILADFERVAEAIGIADAGEVLVRESRGLMAEYRARTARLPHPRVVCLEWTDPPFPMGNWGPELVELAGGTCALGSSHQHSTVVPWERVLAADPDVLVIAPCGFDLPRALAEMSAVARRPGWADLRAVRDRRVYVCDGNRYFNRSGPTLFQTIPLLAHLLHPDDFGGEGLTSLYQRWP